MNAPQTVVRGGIVAALGLRAVDKAESFLRELLTAGPMPARDVEREAKSRRIAWRTLKRAQKRLEILKRKEGRPGDARQMWTWELREGGHEGAPDSMKEANLPQLGPLGEREPATSCDDATAEEGQASAVHSHHDASGNAARIASVGPLGLLREADDANSARGAEQPPNAAPEDSRSEDGLTAHARRWLAKDWEPVSDVTMGAGSAGHGFPPVRENTRTPGLLFTNGEA